MGGVPLQSKGKNPVVTVGLAPLLVGAKTAPGSMGALSELVGKVIMALGVGEGPARHFRSSLWKRLVVILKIYGGKLPHKPVSCLMPSALAFYWRTANEKRISCSLLGHYCAAHHIDFDSVGTRAYMTPCIKTVK